MAVIKPHTRVSKPVLNFYRTFFRDQVPCWDGGDDEGGADSTIAILILTLATIRLPGACFKQTTFLLHTVVLLYCQNYTPEET